MDWIKVIDRLPDEEGFILGVMLGDSMEVFYYQPNQEMFTLYNMGTAKWDEYNVTHWMPLPEPPKD